MAKAATFRANVGIVVARSDGRVAWFERTDHPDSWQFPQGGINRNERPEAAARRALDALEKREVKVGVIGTTAVVRMVLDSWTAAQLVETNRIGPLPGSEDLTSPARLPRAG